MNGMTIEERERLTTKTFDTLWYELWNGQNTRQYRSECASAKKQFEDLTTKGDSDGKLLRVYVDGTKTTWTEPEWGFPKGRRSVRESELTCASREFKEETGISDTCVHILDEPPLIEQYLGTNGIMYKQTYFLGSCSPTLTAHIQTDNRIMQREVGGIGWFTYEEAFRRIRDTNREKRILLETLNMRFSIPDFLNKFQITDKDD
jgi:8-oxo-dGTP pyrophosphatase MutT (NUDIX family)